MSLFRNIFKAVKGIASSIIGAFNGDPRYSQNFEWYPGGGGGGSYTPGYGIDISSNRISAKVDGTTIIFDSNGSLKSTASGDVTKAYVDSQDNKLQDEITEIQGQIDSIRNSTDINSFADVENELESIDEAITSKADKAETYTKSEVDTELAKKADKADTYTKSEVDTELAKKLDKRTTGVEVYSHSEGTQGGFPVKTAMSSTASDANILTEKAVKDYGTSLIKVENVNNPGSIQNGAGLSNGTNYDSNVTPRLIKIGKFACFTAMLKWTAEGATANWTSIYALSSGNTPVRTTPIVVQVYNGATGLNEAAGGTISTNGLISVWCNSKQGTNNYQIRISACFELK